jgi:hypothetical protein
MLNSYLCTVVSIFKLNWKCVLMKFILVCAYGESRGMIMCTELKLGISKGGFDF